MRFIKHVVIFVAVILGFWFSTKFTPQKWEESSLILSRFVHQTEILYVPGIASPIDPVQASIDILKEAQDKPILVNFWASWCESCASEKTFLKDLASLYYPENLKMIGLASQDSEEKLAEINFEDSFSYPVFFDRSGEFMKAYKIDTIPQTLLLDAKGNVITHIKGAIDQKQYAFLNEKVKEILAQKTVASDSKDYGKVSDFSLVNQRGEIFGSKDLVDSIWVANFVFSSCPSMCPALTRKMKTLQDAFASKASLQFVSFSVDPENDTVEALNAYAKKNAAIDGKWHFLTGKWEDIRTLIEKGFKLGFFEDPIFHTDRFVLVGKNLQIKGYYSVNDPEGFASLRREIETLLQESLTMR